MAVTAQQLSLVAEIYETVLDANRWQRLLDKLIPQVSARSAFIVVQDGGYPDAQFKAPSSDIAPDIYAEYVEKYQAYESPAFQKLSRRPPFEWTSDEEAFGRPVEKIESSIWLRDNFGVWRRTGTRLNDSPAWFDALTLHFPPGRGNLTPAEERRAALFLPHLAKAVEIARPFQVLKSRYQAVLDALDRFQIGVMILAGTGTVIVRNREAERILDLDDGLRLDSRHRPIAPRGDGNGALGRAVQQACLTSAAESTAGGALLAVSRRSGHDAYLLEVVPLHGGGELEQPVRGAILFVIDPANRGVVSTQGLQLLYALSDAESEVCRLLIDGYTTNEIADIRNVRPETVRGQLKALLAKTNSRRQSDVVRLALKVNLPVEGTTRANGDE